MLYIWYDIIILDLSTMFYVTMWLCDHDVTIALTLDPRIEKRKEKRKKKET